MQSIMDPTNSSLFSILFSIGVIIVASLNLVLDFDFIEEGSEKGAPKYGGVVLPVLLIDMKENFEILRLWQN